MTSTAVPSRRPPASAARASFASSSANGWISVRIGISAARARNSRASARVKLATLRRLRSHHSRSYGNSGTRSRWMALIATVPPRSRLRSAVDDDVAGRREGHGRVERGSRFVIARRARGPEREGPLLLAWRPGPDVDLAAPVPGDLERQQRRRPEAEQPEPAAGLDPRHLQRAVADHPAAQERRRGQVVEAVGQAQGEVGPDRHPRRVATVAVPAGEPGIRAQVLAARPAEGADAAGRGEPGDAGPVADAPAGGLGAHRDDPAHRLVSGHDRQPPGGEIALRQLEVGAADRAGGNRQHDLVRRRPGIGAIDRHEGAARRRRRRPQLQRVHRAARSVARRHVPTGGAASAAASAAWASVSSPPGCVPTASIAANIRAGSTVPRAGASSAGRYQAGT